MIWIFIGAYFLVGFILAISKFKLSWTWGRSKTVLDPIMKFFFGPLLLAWIIGLILLSIPLHIILKFLGRRGFYVRNYRSWSYNAFEAEGFRRR